MHSLRLRLNASYALDAFICEIHRGRAFSFFRFGQPEPVYLYPWKRVARFKKSEELLAPVNRVYVPPFFNASKFFPPFSEPKIYVSRDSFVRLFREIPPVFRVTLEGARIILATTKLQDVNYFLSITFSRTADVELSSLVYLNVEARPLLSETP